MSKLLAIVPARSGSKRVPNKNIKLINGKPLVVWTLEACLKVNQIEKVFLSTDSLDYWNLVKSHINSEKLCLDLRTAITAGDDVKIFDYLKNNMERFNTTSFSKLILALPTCPLRTSEHIYEAIQLSEKTKKPVFSACKYSFPVTFSFKISDNNWEPLFTSNPMITGNTRSQDQTDTYHPNGAIYIRDIADFYSSKLKTLYDNAQPYVMDQSVSIDIDNLIDFQLAETLMKN